MQYVIIGNGVAGTHAAESIRRLDPQGVITLIAAEKDAPYCRPMISMLLEGSAGAHQLPIRGPDFYDTFKIDALGGDRVRAIDVAARAVTTAAGRRFSFDRLLIASGADPRPIKARGLHLENLFFMRTAAHVRAMLRVLPACRRALVLGGGLVGFKAAYALLRRGLAVTLLIRSGHPLSMQVDREAGAMILAALKKKGLMVRVQAEVTAFEGGATVTRAQLSDGSEIPCDLVVIGKGVLPALDFVPREAIAVDLGVVVDQHLETSAAGIFAAGDAAEAYDIARKTRWVNAIWPEAVAQGRVAGMNMAGRPTPYKGSLGRNVIRIFDLDVMTGGLVNPPPDARYTVLQHHDRRRQRYRKLVFRYDRLVGMVLVNAIEQGGVLLSLIQGEIPLRVRREALMAPSFNFRQLLPATA
jgi:NAD(P)H-nitrite reductase large subunit